MKGVTQRSLAWLGSVLTRHEDSAERNRPVTIPPRKEKRACCVAKRDDLGRLPIGWCGDDCEGRQR